ncbi:inner membrane transport protein YdhC [Halomonas elongata]|uniref:Inner membrane transport protein YdhC n=1 Tax=Halomonas elongata TaxID=2746 RepID=A0A1B8P6H6_HALEL|nr:MFS transporter [Halomonas elongata]OBX37851.1 inner membrane transport protein YdhC [Halomonas elongata]
MPRLSFVLTVAMLSAFGLIASDVYLPAMPSMTIEFGVADWQMPQTVSIYLLALAIAQLSYGPLSDRYGRKPLLLAGIALYMVGSLGCAASGGYTGFLIWRILEAVGAAAGLVIGRALIADICDKRTSAKVYAVVYPWCRCRRPWRRPSADTWPRYSDGGLTSCSWPPLVPWRC